MSVEMTNCGRLEWSTDRRGYRYNETDPETGKPWPVMPGVLLRPSREAAVASGFSDFEPNACLLNRYLPGTRPTLHTDKNELDFGLIVSVSLRMPAVFFFGGPERLDKARRIPLNHGERGGMGRRRSPALSRRSATERKSARAIGAQRLNLTFRKAG